MSGKGSAPRPFDVPREQYESNFDRIFRRKDGPLTDEGTSEPNYRAVKTVHEGRPYYVSEPADVTLADEGDMPTPAEEEAWQELEHKPVYAVQDLGELHLTALPGEVAIPQELFEAICEMERENLMLRARNERLQARPRELTGEEMP